MTARNIGAGGEDIAANFLIARNFHILARNYRTRFGEVDIIAKDGEHIVFVEVKTRANANFADAAESVTHAKRRKLRMVARQWLANRAPDAPARFDVIEVYKNGGINHIPDAFE